VKQLGFESRRTRNSRLEFGAFCLLALLLLWNVSVRAQPLHTVHSCKAADLDILVLPVSNHASTGVSTMPIQFTNLSANTCSLTASGQLEVEPKPTGLGLFWEDYQDSYPSAKVMRERHWEVMTGETVHLLLASSNVPVGSEPCYDVDGMKLGLGNAPGEYAALTVMHVWWHACGTIYVSSYRFGAYSGDETLGSHNRYYSSLRPGDLVPSVEYDIADTHAGELSPTFDRTLLHEYFNLYIDNIDPVRANCPFTVLRRRYGDGTTTVLLTHCDSAQQAGTAPSKPRGDRPRFVIGPSALSLAPEHEGTVTYDAIVETSRAGKETYVHPTAAKIDIRSDQPVKLGDVDTRLPVCLAAQLKVGERVELPGVESHTAQAFNVINTSKYACRIGGVPKAEFFADKLRGTKQYYIFAVCPNCEDKLFAPRQVGWINLAPQASVHLIVGELTKIREPQWACRTTVEMTVALHDDADGLTLPLNAPSCGPVDISAWREGKFDGQPMRPTVRESESQRPSALPPECERQDFSKTGRPVFFGEKNGLGYGMSAPTTTFQEHVESMKLTAWMDNRTDKLVTLDTCGIFDAWNLAVWDVYGNRLLGRDELNKPTGLEALPFCTRSFAIKVKPHSCESISTYELKSQYSLSLGEYRMGRKPQLSTDVNAPQSSAVPPVPFETLRIEVVP
jgi:hypothetical protein